MALFTLEHSKAAYQADFALYGAAVALLAGGLVLAGPRGEGLACAALVAVGLVSWSAVEYALHRFVLHGLRPFSRWHAEHHQRPRALICAPTLLSASLIALLVFLPAALLAELWRACALTLGLLSGYLAYAVTHHATHHWRADSRWLRQRKRWHAIHHLPAREPVCFGVTSAFWDHVFRSHRRAVAAPGA